MKTERHSTVEKEQRVNEKECTVEQTPFDEVTQRECIVTTKEQDVYVDCNNQFISPEEQRSHYAEILTNKPCSSTISLSRRTRESTNPILQLHYDSFSEESCSEKSREGNQSSRDDSALYENVKKHKPVQHSASDSEIQYANLAVHGKEGAQHVYENSEPAKAESDSESLYEDIGDVYEVMTPRTAPSQPINIIYTSVDFPKAKRTPVSSIGSCSFSSSVGSLERSELVRCVSCASTLNSSASVRKPPELPQRSARPTSHYFGQRATDLTEFGMYTGTLVGSCTVTKHSPKAIQSVVADFLSREKKGQSKPVSLEVNNEFLRLSLNCAPWNLLAQSSVEDIGCVTTVSGVNNKTALGYTVSRPGESTRCFVIHCSDVDAIKEAILATFKRPDPTLTRWSSMTVFSNSNKSRSLPRTCSSRPRHNELAIFDELVYLGSYKVKKSYLVVNDNIATVLDHTDSKMHMLSNIELYKDAIHLKESTRDRMLDIQQLDWILSMGLFDEDRRYFGYMSSKAYQGSKTRTFCHVFRCNRVGLASRILESIRQACQATFLARTPESEPYRPRLNSTASTSSSEDSMSSNSETMSHDSCLSSSPTSESIQSGDVFDRVRRRSRSRKILNNFRSYIEEKRTSDIMEEKEEPETPPQPVAYLFNVFYLISTILSPPLKPKHVKACLKQYQKSVDKEMKRTGNVNHYKKVQLLINDKGVTMIDAATNRPQAFFELSSLSGVQGHTDGKCAFAFSTVVGGNAKHKCHLFLQDKEHMETIIQVIQSQIRS